jgi:hypothetical protein
MRTGFLFILLLASLVISEVALSASWQIPVTRNLDPQNHPVLTWDEYQARHPHQAAGFREINRVQVSECDTPGERTERNLLIVVASDLQVQLSEALYVYQQDLLQQQISSFQVTFIGSEVEALRDLIIDWDANETLVGVFLIGDLPTAWFEHYDDFDNDGQPDNEWISQFPCDLFFADLDGLWADLDGNGSYDFHGGGVEPDIWIGRIKADNLTYPQVSEATMINSYFERNHLFRLGLLTTGGTALAYVDDDWSGWGDEYAAALATGWDDVELIDDINATNADDYRGQRLPADYDYIQVMVHSGPDAHYFYWHNHQEYVLVHNWELHGINPTAHFYNLFACSNAHYETDNSMGSLYLLDNDHCLISVGSTKTGSMLRFEDYYTPLGADSTFGSAMQLWWTQNVDVEDDDTWITWQRSWFYGMVTLGDPALKSHYPMLEPAGLTISVSQDSVFLDWDESAQAVSWRVYSADDPYGEFQLDESGEFNGASWIAPRPVEPRFYRVTAVLE